MKTQTIFSQLDGKCFKNINDIKAIANQITGKGSKIQKIERDDVAYDGSKLFDIVFSDSFGKEVAKITFKEVKDNHWLSDGIYVA